MGLFFYLNFILKVKFSIVFFTCDVENKNIIGVIRKELKDEIKKLREKGLGYKKIALYLNVSANKIKSICRREKIREVRYRRF